MTRATRKSVLSCYAAACCRRASVSPVERRATRDLRRRRMPLAHKRGARLAPVHNTNSPSNRSALGQHLADTANRDGVAERFADPAMPKSLEVDLALISSEAALLRDVELTVLKTATQQAPPTLYLLQTVPGIGTMLSLVLLDAIHPSDRVPWVQEVASSCRRIKCAKELHGKRSGTAGSNIGHAHLKWALSEAAGLCLRENPAGQHCLATWEKKHGMGKAWSILAHKVARAVYSMLTRKGACAMQRFLHHEGRGVGERDASLDCHGMNRIRTTLSHRSMTAAVNASRALSGTIPAPSL
jgi:transposase